MATNACVDSNCFKLDANGRLSLKTSAPLRCTAHGLDIDTGCGLRVEDGKLRADVKAWHDTFDCDVSHASGVYCNADNGNLIGPPRGKMNQVQIDETNGTNTVLNPGEQKTITHALDLNFHADQGFCENLLLYGVVTVDYSVIGLEAGTQWDVESDVDIDGGGYGNLVIPVNWGNATAGTFRGHSVGQVLSINYSKGDTPHIVFRLQIRNLNSAGGDTFMASLMGLHFNGFYATRND